MDEVSQVASWPEVMGVRPPPVSVMPVFCQPEVGVAPLAHWTWKFWNPGFNAITTIGIVIPALNVVAEARKTEGTGLVIAAKVTENWVRSTNVPPLALVAVSRMAKVPSLVRLFGSSTPRVPEAGFELVRRLVQGAGRQPAP